MGVNFTESGTTFSVRRISAGNKLGSFHVLEAYFSPFPKFIVGHKESGKYTRGNFLILPPHEIVHELLVGSPDKLIREKLTVFFADHPEINTLLFPKPFSHLTFSSRIDVGWWPVFKKNYVLQYHILPHEYKDDHAIADPYVKAMLKLRDFLSL